MKIHRSSALSWSLLAALSATTIHNTHTPLRTPLTAHPALAATAPTDPNRARAQLANAETALVDLIQHFDALAQKEGGDGIRRVLGTVGTASPLYRIENAAKTLAEDATDPEAFYGGLERLMLDLQRADSDAYSSNFVTFSSAKGTPEDYWRRSLGSAREVLSELRVLESLLE